MNSTFLVTDLPQQLQNNIRVDSGTGCWTWIGKKWGTSRIQYGSVRINKTTKTVHRVIYELLAEKIPEGLCIDHLCRNSLCCNPVHLEPVTQSVNILRGRPRKPRTHCKRGHELTPENTMIQKGDKRRRCRICKRLMQRERYVPRIRQLRTYCRQGHELTPNNAYIDPNDGRRRC